MRRERERRRTEEEEEEKEQQEDIRLKKFEGTDPKVNEGRSYRLSKDDTDSKEEGTGYTGCTYCIDFEEGLYRPYSSAQKLRKGCTVHNSA